MSKRIYVGNLPYTANEDEVRQLFAEYGTVNTVSLITDRETGRPRGFGFVEMDDGADEAIAALDRQDYGGRDHGNRAAEPRALGLSARRDGVLFGERDVHRNLTVSHGDPQ